MNDKRKSNLGPAQLDRLLSQITDRTHSSSDENHAIRTQVHRWLHSSLDDHSILPDSLKESLRVFDKTIVEKSLIDLLLNEDTQPVVLNTLAYCAQEYSLNVTTPSENALALLLYYAALAGLLVFHHQESAEHSLESLVESFTDLKVKPWLPSELKQHIDRACQICQTKQTLNGNDAGRDHLISAQAQAGLGRWVEGVGARIGYYKLLKVLGEGGMGMVYLAEQEQLIRRRVALKIIKPGMDSKRVLARFEAERQALALLDHPNIAQVHDAGTADSGRPYFVMEYVKGMPITEFCDRHSLRIKERLRLLQQVCQAIHHAHQKGIIHRDIKPSNILVSSENDQIIPKIIDFGVAKAVSQPLTERTLITEESQLLGTPEYMSPEQVELANEDIDTRSDIYSLGVLLYELLTGVLPFDSDTLREGGIERIRQVIRETDPKTPSTRLTRLGEEAQKVAENRRTEIGILAKHLRKELEWIPLKAMRKDRSERYRSASELADDIDNYLNGEPLIAGPLGAGYRLRKFVRRNRVLVGGIATVLIVLVAGILVSTMFAIGQARTRAEAENSREEAELIADFLENDVLGSLRRAKIGEATATYMLDAASETLESKFKDRPLIEASIREKLGWTYRRIGMLEEAEQHFLKAIEIYRKHHGDEHPDTLRAAADIGWVYADQGRFRKMERLWTTNLQIMQHVSRVEDQIGTMNALAATYHGLGKYEEAESLFDKILQLVQNELRDSNAEIYPFIRCNLANVYAAQGRYEEAERIFKNTLKDTEWPEELSSWEFVYTTLLANMYTEQCRYNEAEPLFDKALATLRLMVGSEHLHTLVSMCGLARLYIDQKRHEEAENLLREALTIARRRFRLEHPVTLRLVNAYAILHTEQKHYDQAEIFFDEALKGRQRELGDDHPDTLETKNDMAVLYKEQGRYDEAEPLFLEALEGRRLKLGDTHPHTVESLNNLIDLYEAWNKPDKANQW